MGINEDKKLQENSIIAVEIEQKLKGPKQLSDSKVEKENEIGEEKKIGGRNG